MNRRNPNKDMIARQQEIETFRSTGIIATHENATVGSTLTCRIGANS